MSFTCWLKEQTGPPDSDILEGHSRTGMARASPRRPTLARYVPTHFSSCSPQSNAAFVPGQAPASQVTGRLDRPQLSPGSHPRPFRRGNRQLATFFSQHSLAPSTGKRRATSDERLATSDERRNSCPPGSHTVAVSSYLIRPHPQSRLTPTRLRLSLFPCARRPPPFPSAVVLLAPTGMT